MTERPITIRRDKRMQAVHTILEFGHFRHLPVVDEHGRLVGIVSQTDLLAASASMMDPVTPRAQRDMLLTGIAVERAMQPNVVTIDPEATVMAAARTMRRHRVNCLPVVDGSKLVGVVEALELAQ